eukprot:TRINITY_DN263_c0_g4_i5.p1 TRINITY_DN263_c0_g4~~TRINITY_DN263_c0_g4_i5.p1  ORF type:complete len:218 (+),score=34.69 TRINITY_DN263_c0_g4_i5:121-774(+)
MFIVCLFVLILVAKGQQQSLDDQDSFEVCRLPNCTLMEKMNEGQAEKGWFDLSCRFLRFGSQCLRPVEKKPNLGVCGRFTPQFCQTARCNPYFEDFVCCDGVEYNNCCMAACVSNAKNCKAGKCPSVSFPIGWPIDPTPCEVCSLTAGAYLPLCCGGDRFYGSPCFAEKCGNEDLSKCTDGFCGETSGWPTLGGRKLTQESMEEGDGFCCQEIYIDA